MAAEKENEEVKIRSWENIENEEVKNWEKN